MNAKTACRIGIATLLGVAIVTALTLLPVKDYLVAFLDRVQSVGPWGPVLLAGAYVVACVLLVPGSILTLGAGFLFGVVRGAMAVSVGSVLGATGRVLGSGSKRILGCSYARQSVVGAASH